jgi:hypothetical protein
MSTNNPTTIFNQAINEGWNLETDWLWLANRVSRIEQQAVCLERALHINPTNTETKRYLKTLRHQMTQEQSQNFRLLSGHFSKQLS